MKLTRARLLKGGIALVVLGKLPALPQAAPAAVTYDGWPLPPPDLVYWRPKLGWRMIQPYDADYELWQLTYKLPDGTCEHHSVGFTQTLMAAETYEHLDILREEKLKIEAEAFSRGGRWHEGA